MTNTDPPWRGEFGLDNTGIPALPPAATFIPLPPTDESIKELIAAQIALIQTMAELAESIRALAEAIGEPEADEESMVMSRR